MPRPPGDPQDPISPVGGAGAPDASDSPDGASLEPGLEPAAGAEMVGELDAAEASGPEATAASGGVDGPAALQGDADIALALERGNLSPAEAQRALIEQVVERQLPEGASPAERANMRAELEAVLAGDPTLAHLLGS